MPKHDSASEPVRGGGGSSFIGHAATVRPASGNFFRQFLAARRLDVIKYAAPPIKLCSLFLLSHLLLRIYPLHAPMPLAEQAVADLR